MEDSKRISSSKKVFTKSKGQNRITCFCCKQQGHCIVECPKRINLIENESDVKDTPDDPKGKETEAETEELEIIGPYDGKTLMVLKGTTSPIGNKWLRNNIFRLKGTVNGQACTIIIDGGSCENIISQALVDCLKLKVRKHCCPYFARWLKTGDEVQVRYACPVTFSIGEDSKIQFGAMCYQWTMVIY